MERLSAHQWDLEAAVQDALNEKDGIGPVFGGMPPRPSPPPLNQQVHRVNPGGGSGAGMQVVRRAGWLDWTTNLAISPLRFVLSVANELFQFVGMYDAIRVYSTTFILCL